MGKKKVGIVYLVGAGPGDPELITVRGRRLIESADVIMYDALVNTQILNWAKEGAEKIFVGKAHGESSRQHSINQMLVSKARLGNNVMRLKGGDPLVFGRGGEEAEFLASKKIPVEVIPGITAAFGALASRLIPITHRKLSSQLALITGHEDPSKKISGPDYKNLAHFEGTLIFYMGVGRLAQICEELIRYGKNPETPCLVIRWATTPHEETVLGTLNNIVQKARARKLESPSLIIVGEVVRQGLTVNKKQSRPLFGKKVLVTRALKQASSLSDKLQALGAEIVHLPTIRFLAPSWPPVDRAIHGLEKQAFDWVIFTSQNGVDFFADRLTQRSKDWRVFAGVKVACMGQSTADRLREKGICADFVPREFVAEALFAGLKKKYPLKGRRFLLLRGDLARPFLRKALRKEGAKVSEIVIYRTVPEKMKGTQALNELKAGGIDFIPFTSSSSAENFLKITGNPSSLLNGKTKIISIGPITSRTLRQHGLKVYRQAKRYDIDGLIKAMC